MESSEPRSGLHQSEEVNRRLSNTAVAVGGRGGRPVASLSGQPLSGRIARQTELP